MTGLWNSVARREMIRPEMWILEGERGGRFGPDQQIGLLGRRAEGAD